MHQLKLFCCRCGNTANHLYDGHAYCELCRDCYDETPDEDNRDIPQEETK